MGGATEKKCPACDGIGKMKTDISVKFGKWRARQMKKNDDPDIFAFQHHKKIIAWWVKNGEPLKNLIELNKKLKPKTCGFCLGKKTLPFSEKPDEK